MADEAFAAKLIAVLRDAQDPAKQREANKQIEQAERAPGYGGASLRIAGDATQDLVIRQAAAVAFKRFVKKHWDDEEAGVVSKADRDGVKTHLVSIMAQMPPSIQRQLCDALEHVSRYDWPHAWPALLPDLVKQLRAATDMRNVSGVLETADAVFMRFRDAYDSDDVKVVLKHALDTFAEPLTNTVKLLDGKVVEATRARADKAALTPLLLGLRLACSIFYSLNAVDLPEYFEDHLKEWMDFFHRYLTYAYPAIAAGLDDEEGPLESLQAQIVDCVVLYSERYAEEFEPSFPTLLDDVWKLLASVPPAKMLAGHMDRLCVRGLSFLTSIISSPGHAARFKEEATLRAICEKIVVPNIALRPADVEVFEDNPIDFIHMDIEGGDHETRRAVATGLLRALCRQFNTTVTPMCLSIVKAMIAEYDASRGAKAGHKDTAVSLLLALAVKTSTVATGATATNELVPVLDILKSQILPELQPQNVNERPLAKAACIKFVSTFRSLFGREELKMSMRILAPYTAANHWVVHTYAASTIDKMLTVKDKSPAAAPGAAPASGGAGASGGVKLQWDDVHALLPPLFSSLFGRMSQADYKENEYLIHAVLRIITFSKERIAPLSANVGNALTALLKRVSANPTNPSFNHFLFEAIAATVRQTCTAKPEALSDFEALLFPPFQAVLVKDVSEFMPYVFQLLGLLLELRPTPAPGEHSLSEGYKSLLPNLFLADLWRSKGNVPALTELVVAYLHKGSAIIAPSPHFVPLLGVWRHLFVSTKQEGLSFKILNAMFESMPLRLYTEQLRTVLDVILRKVHDSRKKSTAVGFVHAAGIFMGAHGPAALEGVINSIGPGMFLGLVEGVVVPMAAHVQRGVHRRETAVGITRLLSETPALLTDAARVPLWRLLLSTVVELLEPHSPGFAPPAVPGAASGGAGGSSAAAVAAAAASFVDDEEEAEAGLEAPTIEYTAAYAPLSHASIKDRYAFAAMPEPKVYLAQALGRLSANVGPGRLQPIIASTAVAATVQAYLAAAGVTLA